MIRAGQHVTILLADDDEEDRAFATDALRECRFANDLHLVADGVELLDYLHRRGAYAGANRAPTPTLVLLDLDMPRKNGREVLAEMKADPVLRQLPVVVLTTSQADEDVVRTYDLGVSSYIVKPVTFEGLVQAMKTLGRYWFELVELPQHPGASP